MVERIVSRDLEVRSCERYATRRDSRCVSGSKPIHAHRFNSHSHIGETTHPAISPKSAERNMGREITHSKLLKSSSDLLSHSVHTSSLIGLPRHSDSHPHYSRYRGMEMFRYMDGRSATRHVTWERFSTQSWPSCERHLSLPTYL